MNNEIKNIKIIYEDNDLIIVEKPQGIAVSKGKNLSLCDILFKKYPYLLNVKGYKKEEGGLLNRLDNETGGLVFFAKNNKAFCYYHEQMKNEKIIKKYIAIVDGKMENNHGKIDYPIAHDKKNKKKMLAVTNITKKYRGKPQPATTYWKLLKIVDNYSIVEATITKGKRHQIRVHFASIGHPIVGDKLYNKKKENFYHLLYCYCLKFFNMNGEKKIIKVDVPFLYNFKI